MTKVSNEAKNLTRLAGEFLVASRLTQAGYMIALQWGSTIGYDILAFDKAGGTAFIEVKTTASHPRKWILQAKYAHPANDPIPVERRFFACVDMASEICASNPEIFLFPAQTLATALHHAYPKGFSQSPSYQLGLDSKPRGMAKDESAKTIGEMIECEQFRDAFNLLPVEPLM